MEVLASKEEVRQAVAEARRESKVTGLVPTMGALHEGHLSLVRIARTRCDAVYVSIFVNPTQFGPDEDFEEYPRSLESDLDLLSAEDVAAVFVPSSEEMYGGSEGVTVRPGPLGEVLEGASRPGHFDGVCTVVAKLMNAFEPELAFFGEKDYQQLQVIRAMVRDLDFGLGVVPCPTVREADGLAMSSRNSRLSADDRRRATALWRSLEVAREAVESGERDARWIAAAMDSVLGGAEGVEPDYAEVVDAETLRPLHRLDRPARALVAADVGGVRLIDNAPLGEGEVR